MKFHNTLTRQTQHFTPINNNPVSLYTCGPTVYNYGHIGNLRNAIFNDILRRSLEASGYNVKHVMNITDVGHLVSDADEGEDKLEKGAKREGKSVWDVAEHYTQAYIADMAALNILPPNAYTSPQHNDSYARATEFIDDQLAMVRTLVEKDFAYQTEQAIYFDVQKLPNYGELTGQKLADKEVGARSDVITDASKRSPHDFAIWFFATGHFTDHAMQWPSPWGNGFPGWHLECSAIIHATLGDPIDIHTGGIDLIGTHHANEMAQTEAAFGHPLAHIWMHNEFVLVDGTKMSKSKNNVFNLKDILDKGYTSVDYRLLVLQAHYRTELNFSWNNLQAAHQRLLSYQQMADQKWQTASEKGITTKELNATQAFILSSLQDDLNTPQSLAHLSQLTSKIEVSGVAANQQDFQNFLEFLDNVLGLSLANRADIGAQPKQLLTERQKARDAKNFTEADNLRNQLKEYEIGVRDTAAGQVWFKF